MAYSSQGPDGYRVRLPWRDDQAIRDQHAQSLLLLRTGSLVDPHPHARPRAGTGVPWAGADRIDEAFAARLPRGAPQAGGRRVPDQSPPEVVDPSPAVLDGEGGDARGPGPVDQCQPGRRRA